MTVRNDAVNHRGRWIVPTTDAIQWVGTWEEFRRAGGTVTFSEDQTIITLNLPETFKFSIGFFRQHALEAR